MSRTHLRTTASRRQFPLGTTVWLACLGLLAAGCTLSLEDGYKPKPLGASPEVRKSFYASPFTDSAEAGGAGKDSGPSIRPGR